MGDIIQLFSEKPEADPNDPVTRFYHARAAVIALLPPQREPERAQLFPEPSQARTEAAEPPQRSALPANVIPFPKPRGRSRRSR